MFRYEFLKQCRYLFMVVFLFGFTIHQKATPQKDLPVFDLNKKYSEKEFVVEDINVEYIPLETTREVLADNGFSIKYVSDHRIIGINRLRGDIFVFDRHGKIVSFFNHKGGGGVDYLFLMSIVFDEANKEIFVADIPNKNRCVVYSEGGKFLRQFSFPADSWIGELYNFDDQTLLAYNQVQAFGFSGLPDSRDINQRTPYVFLSKKDGSIVSRINLSFPERISDTHVVGIAADGTEKGITVSTPFRNMKYGREFIIADRSSDTVFLLTQDKRLTPLFVRMPSVFDKKQSTTVLYFHFKINSYLFFRTVTYDVPKITQLKEKGKSTDPAYDSRFYVYDMYTGNIFTPVGRVPLGLDIDAPGNTLVRTHPADILIKSFEKSRINNKKLEQIAKTLGEEDNPVVEITRYK